ncbi:MAG: hypothetical protein M3N98_13700 [Actinomycetota bacterium]|nr:hypothetical protein [Actinomycetota bacterium]
MITLRFAKSANKHHVAHERAAYVVNHCQVVLPQPPPAGDPDDHDERLVFLGDDRNGIALEVVAIEGVTGELLVIHAQKLRNKNRAAYRRVTGYQK